MVQTDVRSPGGWLQLYGVRIAKALALGVPTLVSAFVLWGTFNGGQAEHYIEGAIETQTGAKIVAFAERNPFLNSTGAIMVSDDQGVFLDEATTVAGFLDVGVTSSASQSGQNIFNSINLTGAKRFISTSASGASAFRTAGMILVGSGQYVTATYSATSGATLSGNDPAFIRLKWINCSDVSSTVDC